MYKVKLILPFKPSICSMMVEGNWCLGEGGLMILYFHLNFVVLNTGNPKLNLVYLKNIWNMSPGSQPPVCCPWGVPTSQSFHVLPGRFLSARKCPTLGPAASLWLPGRPTSSLRGSYPGGRCFFAKKAISKDL